MRGTILSGLQDIERIKGIEILFASESGSRAWGFESVNSDWDVRFIYKHPPAWYFSIGERRDVTEIMDKVNNIDYVGWELRKALRLMRKSNPELFGWVRSPHVYVNTEVGDKIQRVCRDYFNARAACHHYLHMAEGNYKAYLTRDPVPYKKYLYVVRPLLACHHIRKCAYEPAVEFTRLIADAAPDNFPFNDVRELLDKKRSGLEMGEGPRLPDLDRWCADQIRFFNAAVGTLPTNVVEPDKLEEILLTTVLRNSGHFGLLG
jgi:uncharacterized protein